MYDESKVYAKYLKDKLTHGHSGCSECNDSSNPCDCCPPGLVATYDGEGNRLGCLTPNDAQEFVEATRSCAEGYVAVYKESPTPTFRGCVSETEFEAVNAALNPA